VRKLYLLLFCTYALVALGQTNSPKFEPGTVMAVTAHQSTPGEPLSDVSRYDVSVKIGNVLYVVLYTPRNGANAVEYSPGIEMLFSVGNRTLTFNSKLSGTTEVPILRRENLPDESPLEWSKAKGDYFGRKQRHLSEALNLTDDQKTKIKPALEHEAAEAGAILRNPALSPKDQLKQYEKLINASDLRIKSFLSPSQTDRLRQLRKEQKGEMKRIILEGQTDRQN
jgi:hypothetical protein